MAKQFDPMNRLLHGESESLFLSGSAIIAIVSIVGPIISIFFYCFLFLIY